VHDILQQLRSQEEARAGGEELETTDLQHSLSERSVTECIGKLGLQPLLDPRGLPWQKGGLPVPLPLPELTTLGYFFALSPHQPCQSSHLGN
jgi:hypothetical protein